MDGVVTAFDADGATVTIDDVFGHDVDSEQHFSLERAVQAIQLYAAGQNVNPTPPVGIPYQFSVLKVYNDVDLPRSIYGEYIRGDDVDGIRMWHCANGGLYLWRDAVGEYWCLGLVPFEKIFCSSRKAAWPHEARSWEFMNGSVKVDFGICFKAYTARPAVGAPVGGAPGGGAPGGGARGRETGGSTARAAGGAPAGGAAGGGAPAGSVQGLLGAGASGADDAVDRLMPNDRVRVFFPPDNENEGYFDAIILSVGHEKVKCRLEKDYGGTDDGSEHVLDDEGHFELDYGEALHLHMAYANGYIMPSPHEGRFHAIQVTHASYFAMMYRGKYTPSSEIIMHGMPVYMKDHIRHRDVTCVWRLEDRRWVFGAVKESGDYVPYAVGKDPADMLHHTRDFVVEHDKSVKIFSYAIKYETPPIADLSKGDVLIASYDPDDCREGWCTAKIESEDNRVRVKFSCHRNREGQLDGKASGEFTRAKALLFRRAFIDQVPIPRPHSGPFSAVVVTHATKDPVALVGWYKYTSERKGGKPVYVKDEATNFVTFLWCSPAGPWVFGKKGQMDDTPNRGFAVAQKASPMPHFTHEFFIQGLTAKIYSHSIKAGGDDESGDDESDEDEAGARRPHRTKRVASALVAEPAKKQRSGGAGGGAAGGAACPGFR